MWYTRFEEAKENLTQLVQEVPEPYYDAFKTATVQVTNEGIMHPPESKKQFGELCHKARTEILQKLDVEISELQEHV